MTAPTIGQSRPSATPRPGHPRAVIKARIAVYLTFFANGLGFSNLVPRYPEVVEHLGITKGVFGQAIMFVSVGGLVAGLTASWFIARFTSARVASIGMIVLGLGLVGASLADHWIVFALCMAWVGGTDAVIDVAQNAHGLRVERRWGGSIITSFHAAWSLGAVVGAAIGQAMAGAGVPIAWHMALVLLLLTAVSSAALPWTIKGPDSEDRRVIGFAEDPTVTGGVGAGSSGTSGSSESPTAGTLGASTVTAPIGRAETGADSVAGAGLSAAPGREPGASPGEEASVGPSAAVGSGARGLRGARPHRPSRAVVVLLTAVLGLMCAAAMFPEDVTGNWSSLLLTEQGAAAGMTGMGMVALQSVMIVGRLIGDAVIDRLGSRAVIAGGGVLVIAGMGTALLLDSVVGTILGMMIAGAGCAVAVPVAYAAADDIPGLRPGLGLTLVSWLARVIMLIAPPVVGWFADDHGTWVALVYGLLGGLILLLSWPALRSAPRPNAVAAATPTGAA